MFVSRLTKAMREIKKRKKRKKRDAQKGSQSKPAAAQSKPAADAKVVDCDEKRPSGAESVLEVPAQSASAATTTT